MTLTGTNTDVLITAWGKLGELPVETPTINAASKMSSVSKVLGVLAIIADIILCVVMWLSDNPTKKPLKDMEYKCDEIAEELRETKE